MLDFPRVSIVDPAGRASPFAEVSAAWATVEACEVKPLQFGVGAQFPSAPESSQHVVLSL